MLQIANVVFQELNKQQINYCHFKSNEHLEAGLNGETDLDILIDLKDREKSEKIFKNLGLKRFEPVGIGEYPGVVNWYGFDKTKGKLIHLHTHYNLITGKGLVKDYYLHWEKTMLENTVLNTQYNVKICNPSLEYILLCTRIIIKRKITENFKSSHKKAFIDKDFLTEIDYLKKNYNITDIEEYIKILYSKKNNSKILELMLKMENLTNWEFYELNKIIRRELRSSRRMTGKIASIKSIKNKISRRIIRKLNRNFNCMIPLKKRCYNKGLSIAFVGIDGSGKSTVSSEIEKWINTEFDAKKYYAGAGDGNKNLLSSILLNVYKKNKVIANAEKKIDNKKSNGKFYIKIKNLFGAISYYKILKDNINNIVKINRYCEKGCFCIMDRFPQGQIENEHDGPKIQKYLKIKNFRVVNRLAKKEKMLLDRLETEIPKIDILFKMSITPELAIERKPDHNYKDLAQKSETLNLINFAAKKTITIDASRKLEEVILEVKKNIWDAI